MFVPLSRAVKPLGCPGLSLQPYEARLLTRLMSSLRYAEASKALATAAPLLSSAADIQDDLAACGTLVPQLKSTQHLVERKTVRDHLGHVGNSP